MAFRVRRLLLAAALVWAVVAGAGSSDLISQWRTSGTTDGTAVTAADQSFDVTVPGRAGGVLTAVARRGPALTAEPGAFTAPAVATLLALALALLLPVRIDVPPTARRGPVRRRGPPALLITRA